MIILVEKLLYVDMGHEGVADEEDVILFIVLFIIICHGNREVRFAIFILVDEAAGGRLVTVQVLRRHILRIAARVGIEVSSVHLGEAETVKSVCISYSFIIRSKGMYPD